jgi:hypothetical protein
MPIIGTDVIVEGTFRDVDDQLTTPTTYAVDYKTPSGVVATIAQIDIDNPSTGRLVATIPTDQVGVWRYSWHVTIDDRDLVVSGGFCVDPSGTEEDDPS